MASKAQRERFGLFLSKEGGNAYYQEVASAALREWYRRGQAAFRQTLSWGPPPDLQQFNDLLFPLKDHERDGFLMGWQSDQWAYDNEQPYSVEGTTSILSTNY